MSRKKRAKARQGKEDQRYPQSSKRLKVQADMLQVPIVTRYPKPSKELEVVALHARPAEVSKQLAWKSRRKPDKR